MKNILLLFALFFAVSATAQEKKEVKIKKEIKSEASVADSKSKVKKTLDVEKEIVNGEEVTRYKLVEESDGEMKVTVWDGTGEVPAALEEEVARVKAMEMEREDGDVRKEKKVIIIKDGDGEEEVMEWHSDGDETYVIEIEEDGHKMKKRQHNKMKVKSGSGHDYDVKVRMGIGLDTGSDGVKASYVEADSPAHKAGIKKGDVILKIGDTYVLSEKLLFKALSQYKPGDKTDVVVLREGAEKKLKITLEGK